MKLTEVTKIIIFECETQEGKVFTRYSSDNWNERIGESEESIYDKYVIEELERAFKESDQKTKDMNEQSKAEEFLNTSIAPDECRLSEDYCYTHDEVIYHMQKFSDHQNKELREEIKKLKNK